MCPEKLTGGGGVKGMDVIACVAGGVEQPLVYTCSESPVQFPGVLIWPETLGKAGCSIGGCTRLVKESADAARTGCKHPAAAASGSGSAAGAACVAP